MRPRFCAAVLLLCLAFASSANGDQWYGMYTAVGTGLNQADAAQDAVTAIDEFVDSWEETLEPGQEIKVVYGSTEWDLPFYTINYWIVVTGVGT